MSCILTQQDMPFVDLIKLVDGLAVAVFGLIALRIIWKLYRAEKRNYEQLLLSYNAKLEEQRLKHVEEKEQVIQSITVRHDRQTKRQQDQYDDLVVEYRKLSEQYRVELQRIMQENIGGREETISQLENLSNRMIDALESIAQQMSQKQ